MKMEDYCITSKNDMYLYIEAMRQFEPEAVLDMGMFLKRAGAISRSIGDLDISNDCVIDGVDFAPQIKAEVYRNVYDDIEEWQKFGENCGAETAFSGDAAGNLRKFRDKKYALAFLMRCENFLHGEDFNSLFAWMSTHVENVVVTGKFEDLEIDMKKWQSVAEVEPLKLDDDEYCIVHLARRGELLWQ